MDAENGNGDNVPAAPQEPVEEHADEVQPINEQPPAPTDRFELDPEAAEEKWELPNNLLEYIHKYIKLHVADKDIKDSIVWENPVPTNLKQVPDLDSYIRTILSNNNKSITLKSEKTLKTIQDKMFLVFGPLLKIWDAVDQEKSRNPEDESTVHLSHLLDQTILLLSQIQNSCNYHRRENILSTLIDSSSRVKDILKNQSQELNKADNKHLFGEEFETKLIKDTKAIKKSESVFTGVKASSSTSTRPRFPAIGSKRPFPGGSFPASRGRGHSRPGFSFRGRGNFRGRGRGRGN
ncbi:uncharacterized protein [Clytia hemisphaerica]|uniref:Uncharacterized protein n=1 Tax=Clytia hemisphaerica TaxID=252671 RepID=A0A7M5TSH4_9CNID